MNGPYRLLYAILLRKARINTRRVMQRYRVWTLDGVR